MATAFTHAFIALAAGRACYPRQVPGRFWFLAPICSAIPDADVGLHSYGVQYQDLWGHRGMTHSLAFALILSLIVVVWFFRDTTPRLSRQWWGLLSFFFVLTASHGFIDAFTDGGLGIAFFAPFSDARYFMPWRPIPVSHFGIQNVFTPYGAHVLVRELILVCLPVAVLAVLVYLVQYRRLGPHHLTS
jgi:inner membrane protein